MPGVHKFMQADGAVLGATETGNVNPIHGSASAPPLMKLLGLEICNLCGYV